MESLKQFRGHLKESRGLHIFAEEPTSRTEEPEAIQGRSSLKIKTICKKEPTHQDDPADLQKEGVYIKPTAPTFEHRSRAKQKGRSTAQRTAKNAHFRSHSQDILSHIRGA